jgi:riboflavin kinase/FMN adenylyltransferase
MLNLGSRPTFGEHARAIEAHLFDAAGEWYDAEVRVEFIARLRETARFADTDALRAQLARDEEAARRALTLYRRPGTLQSSATTTASPSKTP